MVYIAGSVLLDTRLALYHEDAKWLAIADLHFGFELSQRRAGRLVPFWGMDPVSLRLLDLLDDYQPRCLIIIGDIVHDGHAAAPALQLLARAAEKCEVIAIAGNHDREFRRLVRLRDEFQMDEFLFHHGDCARERSGTIQVIGHLHPAATLRDGAGLRLKFPAFVQERGCWIMPAFSPWAAGGNWTGTAESRVWLCTPSRILPLHGDQDAA